MRLLNNTATPADCVEAWLKTIVSPHCLVQKLVPSRLECVSCNNTQCAPLFLQKRKEAFLSTELQRPLVLKEIKDKDVFTENIYISKIEINKQKIYVC